MSDWWSAAPIASQGPSGSDAWWQSAPIAGSSSAQTTNQTGLTSEQLGLTDNPKGILDRMPFWGTIIKDISNFVAAPGRAYNGGYSAAPAQPGQLSDEDLAREQINQDALINHVARGATYFSPSAPGALTTSPGASSIGILNNKIPLIADAVSTPAVTDGVAASATAVPSASDVVEAAQKAGVSVPRVALMPPWVQKTAAGLSDIPIVGEPLRKSADLSKEQAKSAITGLAGNLGLADQQAAGDAIKSGVSDFKTNILPRLQAYEYAPIDAAISDAKATFPAPNTQAAIQSIQDRLAQSGGELNGIPARIADVLQSGQVSKPDFSAAINDALQTMPVGKQSLVNASRAAGIADEQIAHTLGIQPPQSAQSGGVLTFQGMKDLRSALGNQMADVLNRQGYDDFVDSSLYGALTKDLGGVADQLGVGDQWNKANAVSSKLWDQFNGAKPYGNPVSNSGSVFERVYGLTMDRKGDTSKLVNLKNTLAPNQWGDVAATTLNRMGQGNNGQFSMQAFLSSYNKMNPDARGVLFGDSSKSVDDLATVFGRLQALDRYKSTSNSSNWVPAAEIGSAAIGAIFHPVLTAKIAAGGATGYGVARLLAKPATARAISGWAKAYEIAVRRPTAGTWAALQQRSGVLGTMAAKELGAPEAARSISNSVMNVVSNGLQNPPEANAAQSSGQ